MAVWLVAFFSLWNFGFSDTLRYLSVVGCLKQLSFRDARNGPLGAHFFASGLADNAATDAHLAAEGKICCLQLSW